MRSSEVGIQLQEENGPGHAELFGQLPMIHTLPDSHNFVFK
jgi:hypothetical protein